MNSLQDRMIGTSTLDVSKLHPSQLSYLELPVSFAKDKYAKSGAVSRLVVAIRGWVVTYGTLRSRLQAVPGKQQWTQHNQPWKCTCQMLELMICTHAEEKFA